MNLTSFKATLRKSSALVGVLAVVMVGVITLATIWFLNKNEGPVAPNAPASQPQASGNACSVQFGVQNLCSGFKVFNATTHAEIPAGTSVIKGTKLQWSCTGLPGTNYFKYRYRTSNTADFKIQSEGKVEDMADANNPISTALDTTSLSYLEVRCRPFAGDFGAVSESVVANCNRVITLTTTEIPPKLCTEACTADSQCTTGLKCLAGMCRNQLCAADNDCSCDTTVVQCSQACTDSDQCAAGLTCLTGMCRNATCSDEADCACNPAALSCNTGAFNEIFGDSTLDTKLEKLGSGTVTVSGGVGNFSVLSSRPPYDPRALLSSLAPISGDLMASLNINSLTLTPAMNTGVARLLLAGEDQTTFYRLDWRKGANGSSQIVSDIVTGSTGAVSGEKSTSIPADSQVRFRIERENSTIRMYYKLGSNNEVLHQTYTGATMAFHIRSGIVSADTAGTLKVDSAMDNYSLACIPKQCSASCSSDTDCVSGLSCNGGMCRNDSCTNEADCTCPNEPVKSSDLEITTLTCTNQNFDAKVTVKQDNAVKADIDVTFKYNGQTKTDTTDSNGVAQVSFTYAANQTVIVEIEDGWPGHSRGVSFSENCPTGTPTPTATPTGTPTGTPTPTPVASCNNTCVTSSDCRGGLTCTAGACRNSACTNKTNCTCDVIANATPAPGATATPTPTTLPSAGSTGQTIALVAIGFTVIGLGVTRFKFLKK